MDTLKIGLKERTSSLVTEALNGGARGDHDAIRYLAVKLALVERDLHAQLDQVQEVITKLREAI